jgi:BirA family biotin operon repressor/biotin-[acetyl-CoA-carboxylase] ligase
VSEPSLRELQAEVLHGLGRTGPVSVAEFSRRFDAESVGEALADLAAGGLIEPPGDGVIRPGPRGSVLSAKEVSKQLTTRRLGRPLEIFAAVRSTNDVVLQRAATGVAPGLCVAAELQTAGRGRRGRSFDSRPGLGVWCSTLLDSPSDPAAAPRLSLVAALAVAGAIEGEAGEAATIKWPNDVLLRDRKVCGILIEARSAGGSTFPVTGIGINVHHRDADFPQEIRETAGSLEGVTGLRLSRSRLLAALLNRLEPLLDEDRAGSLDLPARFAERDALLGREVVAQGAGAAPAGIARGIDRDGRLLLDVVGAGRVAVRGGEVTVRAAAR